MAIKKKSEIAKKSIKVSTIKVKNVPLKKETKKATKIESPKPLAKSIVQKKKKVAQSLALPREKRIQTHAAWKKEVLKSRAVKK